LADVQRARAIIDAHFTDLSVYTTVQVVQNLLDEHVLNPDEMRVLAELVGEYSQVASRHPNGGVLGMRQSLAEITAKLDELAVAESRAAA
jgi:hypothetical protein